MTQLFYSVRGGSWYVTQDSARAVVPLGIRLLNVRGVFVGLRIVRKGKNGAN
jgi:hypothetical protein